MSSLPSSTSSQVSTVDTFVNNALAQNKGTAKEYKKRLNLFSKFVREIYDLTLDELITTLTIEGYGPKIDVYHLLSAYVSWLSKRGSMSPGSIKSRVATAKHYLETFDIDISPRKFQLKVKTPRVIRTYKEALSKEDIQTILNACSSSKLKTYLLFLAATGCRAGEALSLRLCDINFNASPVTVFIRGEYTKTKVSRYVFLTNELAEQLRSWISYKYRTRSIGYYDNKNKRTMNKIVKPSVNNKVFIFTSNWEKSPALENLYTNMLTRFEHMLDRLGGKFSEFEDEDNSKRRKITFHSFRRYVKGVISDLGYADYSEYFIGHQGSTYYRKTEREKIQLFKKIEPYLSYLDYGALEKRSNDMQTRLETMERENQMLRQKDSMNTDAIANLSDKMHELTEKIQNLENLR